MGNLAKFVIAHTIRGACTCGKCIDSPVTYHPGKAEEYQPQGEHTADVYFFKVAAEDSPDKEEFLSLIKVEFPHWLDGNEHNYIEMGADIGDQGLALMTMGLGTLLGVWAIMTPENMLGGMVPKELRDQMAGVGYISITTKKAK